ncbi:permuted papain-like amidase YaeF/Yiix C92 family enzyme [Thiogranum longum]|uniref:Permuted papain-like amidase YaeF/Yiix C92 family enzyme n=1 Tax=Thiogranum longum TaxID=1537524 RepID=A0A4R1HM65_9GAMM|nr:YiiX/YebB-like N1pC/P60 family cysteine hydrolase [Thiogranum longum]TCK18322.1 permuted papain-like amidase YaeF/Yiix C92 family enzyme [Thiogranum longum]
MVFNPAAWLGRKIVRWLTIEHQQSSPPLCDFDRIRYEVRPCDVILVEGRSRVSEIIRTITQSPWSHSALYIGRVHDIDDPVLRGKILSFYDGDPNEQLVIEAWLGEGMVVNPLSKYRNASLRICRPTGLTRQDAQYVLEFSLQHLGFDYDLRQLLDLARFLLPYSVIPRRWRSSLFEHNAGLPTRSVCSSMIAAAFASVKFPVLPVLEEKLDGSLRMIPRNTRLFTPRDFDYSPYFEIIKCPHLDFGKSHSYHGLPWDKKGRICNDHGECFVPTMQPDVAGDKDTVQTTDIESATGNAAVSGPDAQGTDENEPSGTEKTS